MTVHGEYDVIEDDIKDGKNRSWIEYRSDIKNNDMKNSYPSKPDFVDGKIIFGMSSLTKSVEEMSERIKEQYPDAIILDKGSIEMNK